MLLPWYHKISNRFLVITADRMSTENGLLANYSDLPFSAFVEFYLHAIFSGQLSAVNFFHKIAIQSLRLRQLGCLIAQNNHF